MNSEPKSFTVWNRERIEGEADKSRQECRILSQKGQDVNTQNKLGREKGGDNNTCLPRAMYLLIGFMVVLVDTEGVLDSCVFQPGQSECQPSWSSWNSSHLSTPGL